MRVFPSSWMEKKEYEGVAFFVQCIDEMLFDYAYDSYRAPSMNTFYRLQEGIRILSDVIENQLNPKIAQPVVEEISWSMNLDLAVREIRGVDVEYICGEIDRNKNNIKEALKILIYAFRSIEGDYFRIIKDRLVSVCENGKRKEEIYRLTQDFCSHVINCGYDRRFIKNKVKSVIVDAAEGRSPHDSLQEFIGLFSQSERKYQVYSRLSEQAVLYCLKNEVLPFLTPSEAECHKDVHQFFSVKREKRKTIKIESVDALDPYSARRVAEIYLSTVRSYASTVGAARHFSWDDAMLVSHEGEDSIQVGRGVDTLERRTLLPFAVRMEQFQKRISIFSLQDMNMESMNRINLSLRSFSSAFGSKSDEMKLIALWSALEAIMPVPKEGARIENYIKYAIPCISKRYIQMQFEWIYADLNRIHGSEFKSIVESVSIEGDNIRKFIAIVCLAEYRGTVLPRLFSLCNNNHLAKNRLFNLAKKFETTEEMKKFVDSHVAKVKWQFHRIYRTRNSIVHNGSRLPYLQAILMNLHEYFMRIIREVQDKCLRPGLYKTIDVIFEEIVMDDIIHKRYIKSLGKNAPIDRANLFRITRIE